MSPSWLGEVSFGDIRATEVLLKIASSLLWILWILPLLQRSICLLFFVSSLKRYQLLLTTEIQLQRQAVGMSSRRCDGWQLGIAGFPLMIKINFTDTFNALDLLKMKRFSIVLVRGNR